MAIELKIPTAGESITEVQIGEWYKSEGDWVERDEAVVEIETDKASMELPAPDSGVLAKILIPTGEIANVGDVIGHIDETASKPPEAKAAKAADGAAAPGADAQSSKATSAAATGGDGAARRTAVADSATGADRADGDADGRSSGQTTVADLPPEDANRDVRIMPAAQRIMAEHGLSPADITATGPGGRILKEDAQRAAESGRRAGESGARARSADREGEAPAEPNVAAGAPARRGRPDATASQAPAAGSGPRPRAAEPPGGDRPEEVVPMSMLRRRIAERLVDSQKNAAILTTFNEIDMSAVMALRAERQDAFVKRYGVKLGFMSFFVKAAIDALKLIPAVNGEVRGTDIVYKNYFDIGVAVSTDRGLVVPVVRNAERLSFAEVELAIADLATRARDRKLELAELQGGTFTISNGGIFGSLLSTPIINPPQSAILGLHAIEQRPVAIDGKVEIRPMMYVALSYDHRIIDGRESVTFLKRIKECVQDPARMLIEV